MLPWMTCGVNLRTCKLFPPRRQVLQRFRESFPRLQPEKATSSSCAWTRRLSVATNAESGVIRPGNAQTRRSETSAVLNVTKTLSSVVRGGKGARNLLRRSECKEKMTATVPSQILSSPSSRQGHTINLKRRESQPTFCRPEHF